MHSFFISYPLRLFLFQESVKAVIFNCCGYDNLQTIRYSFVFQDYSLYFAIILFENTINSKK